MTDASTQRTKEESESSSEPMKDPSSAETTKPKQKDKVLILVKSVGNAPILKKNRFKISADSPFEEVMQFMKKILRIKPSESLFLYCNQAFCPNPDELVGDLFESFGSNNMLVVNYCLKPAYG